MVKCGHMRTDGGVIKEFANERKPALSYYYSSAFRGRSLSVMPNYNSYTVTHLVQLILCNLTEYCLTLIGLHRSESQCVAVYMNSLAIMSLFDLHVMVMSSMSSVFTEHRLYTIKCRLIIDEDDHKGWGKPHMSKGEWSENRYFAEYL